MNQRGQYGTAYVGQDPPRGATIYVEHEPSSIGAWIIGTIVVGGAVLWARHQSQQIAQLNKMTGLPSQRFTTSLRQGASARLHVLAERVRPQRPQGRDD